MGRSQDELGLEGTLGESGGSGWMPYTMHRYQDGTYGWMEPLREGWDEVSKPVSHPPPEPVDHESWWVAGFLAELATRFRARGEGGMDQTKAAAGLGDEIRLEREEV